MELLRTCNGMVIEAHRGRDPHVTVERLNGGCIRIEQHEVYVVITALCGCTVLLAESVADVKRPGRVARRQRELEEQWRASRSEGSEDGV